MFRLTGILLALLLLLTAGCSTPGASERDRQEILQVIETRRAALNTKNLPGYVSVISQNYNDKSKDYARVAEELKSNFAKFEQISYEADAPAITVSGASADATVGYRMKVRVQGKELSLKGIEHLKLVREPEGWKIIAGI